MDKKAPVTFLELDLNFYIEISMEKTDRALKRLINQ